MSDSVLTTEQQEAFIGRTILAKRAAEKRLALLLAEAKRIGDELGNLAGYMKGNAHFVWLEALSNNENYPHPTGEMFSPLDISAVKIARLTSEIRDAKDEVSRLGQEDTPAMTKDERVLKLASELVELARKHPIRHEAFDALDVAKILFRPALPPRTTGQDSPESLLDQASALL